MEGENQAWQVVLWPRHVPLWTLVLPYLNMQMQSLFYLQNRQPPGKATAIICQTRSKRFGGDDLISSLQKYPAIPPFSDLEKEI